MLLLLLLLSLFSRVRLCATQWTAAHQAPRPWDSPGKNTGVGCHCLLQCMKVKSESEVAQSCPTPSDPMDCSLPGPPVHGIFPGKSTGVGCHCLLPSSAAAKSLQSCPTLCDPRDGSPPGPPSLGFSRQEHWSGLPFPSPMHESEK